MFIAYDNILINPVDVSWARVENWDNCWESDKPWSLIIHFRGVSEFLHFEFETRDEAKKALHNFENLVRVATENNTL